MTKLFRVSRVLCALLLASALSACGGGGSSNTESTVNDDTALDDGDTNADNNNDDNSQGDDEQEVSDNTGNDEVDETDTGTNDSEDNTQTNPDENSGGDDGANSADNGDSENDIDSGTDTTNTGNNGGDNLSAAIIVAETDGPAWGTEDTTIYRLDNGFSVTDDGHVMFSGSSTFDYQEDAMLWRGRLHNPVLALRTGMALPEFPQNIRLDTFDRSKGFLADDGSVTIPAVFAGARSANTVLLADDSGVKVVFRSDQSIEIDGASYDHDNYSVVRHHGTTVAALGTAGLLLWNNGAYEYIAPFSSQSLNAPLQPDGCRIALDRFDIFRDGYPFLVRDDGSVIFNGKVFVEPGAEQNVAVCPDRNRVIRDDGTSSFTERLASSDFQTVAVYRDGSYNRLVSTGDPVPGMNNAVFTEVGVLDILEGGSLLVGATIKNVTVRGNDKKSRWIFDENAAPRLVLLEGETVESSVLGETYVMNLGNANGYGGLSALQVLQNGSTQATDAFGGNRDQGVTWLIAGQAHPGQPYTDVLTPGASPLKPIVATGYPPPADYPESAYWSSIGAALLLSTGDGIFFGSISDSAPGASNPVASGLWRYNSNGEISRALPNELIVNINEIPRTLSVNYANMQPVGDRGLLYHEDPSGRSERLIYVPYGLTSDQ